MNILLNRIYLLLMFLPLVFWSCDIKPVEAGDIQDVKLKNLSPKGVSLEVSLPINNPNGFKFKIKKIDIEISMNNTKLGNITEADKIIVPANSNDLHTFIIKVEFSKLMGNPLSLFQTLMSKRANIRLNGEIVASAFLVTKKIKIDETQSIDLKK